MAHHSQVKGNENDHRGTVDCTTFNHSEVDGDVGDKAGDSHTSEASVGNP